MLDALPHTQKIIHKPEGVGTLLINLVTGVMLILEETGQYSLLAQCGRFSCVSPTFEAIV